MMHASTLMHLTCMLALSGGLGIVEAAGSTKHAAANSSRTKQTTKAAHLGAIMDNLVGSSTPGSLVIDVGLAHGSECIAVGRADRVCHGFEANPRTAADIQKKVTEMNLRDRVHVKNRAIGSKKGTVQFYVSTEAAFSAGSSLTEQKGSKAVDVTMVRLDDEFPSPGEKIFLLKTDTQGHELGVLQGAEKLLSSGRVSFLLVEFSIHLMPKGKKDANAILDLLQKYSYHCSDLVWHTAYNTVCERSRSSSRKEWLESLAHTRAIDQKTGKLRHCFTDLLCERRSSEFDIQSLLLRSHGVF